jgi:hypothetical protein
MKPLLLASFVAGALLVSGAAVACEGPNVVLEDQFTDDSGGWDPSDSIKFAAPGMTIDIGAEYTNYKELNSAFAVGDADICVDFAFPKGAAKNPAGGIMFWGIDYSNFYLLQVSQAGTASLWRLKDGKWNKLYSADDVAAIKTDPGASNTLRVTVKGGSITAYVNGEKFRSQKAQAPKADSQFGAYVQIDEASPDAAARTFTINSYKVTDVQ